MMLGPERLTPIVMTLWLVLLKPALPLTDGREREAKDKSLRKHTNGKGELYLWASLH